MTLHVLHGLEAELGWLRDSGIQSPRGGLHAWADAESGRLGPLSPEVTGYFISLCAALARCDRRRGWLARAEAAARWLVDEGIEDGGGVLGRLYAEADAGRGDPFAASSDRVRLLDCAVVGNSLLTLHGATGRPLWLDTATRIGDFALRVFESSDASYRYAAYDLSKKVPVLEGPEWYGHHGPQHMKALPFFDALSRYHRVVECSELVERALEVGLASQTADGRFPTGDSGSATHLHPHFYAVEGLLHLASVRERTRLLDPALKAIGWAFERCLLAAPPLQRWSHEPDESLEGLRADAVAQGLRAYYLAKLLRPTATWPWEARVGEIERSLEQCGVSGGGTHMGLNDHGPTPTRANARCHFFRLQAKIFDRLRAKPADVEPANLLLV